jgi:HTH-type transcriptional regulator / antitoxin HipB
MRESYEKNGLLITPFTALEDEWFGKPGSSERITSDEGLRQELIMARLGAAIQQTRKARNLSQGELGKRIGVGKAQVSKLENAPGNVTVGTLLRVFTALGARLTIVVESLDEPVADQPELGGE